MKLALTGLTGTVLLLVMITEAAANPLPPEPASTEAEQIQPISPQTNGNPGAAAQAETLEQSAEQINQDLDGRLTRGPQLRDLLDLPDGMIIRGSSRGGLGIGTEY